MKPALTKGKISKQNAAQCCKRVYPRFMVLILDGNSEHGAHASRKIGLFGEKTTFDLIEWLNNQIRFSSYLKGFLSYCKYPAIKLIVIQKNILFLIRM